MTDASTSATLYLLLPALGIAGFVALHHGLIWLSDRNDKIALWTALWALTSFVFIGTRHYHKTHLDPNVALICIRILIVTLCALVLTLASMVRAIIGRSQSGPAAWLLWGLLFLIVTVGQAWSVMFATDMRLRADRSGIAYYGVDDLPVVALLMVAMLLGVLLVARSLLQGYAQLEPELRRERKLLAIGVFAMLALALNDLLQVFYVYHFYMLAEFMPIPLMLVMSIIAARRQYLLRSRLEARVAERTIKLLGSNRQLQEALRDAVQSEVNLRTLFDASPDAILVARDRDILIGNNAAIALLGDLSGRRLGDILFGLDLGSLPIDQPQSHEFRRQDGSIGHAELLCKAMMLEGRLANIWILRDVTERKLLETQLQKAERLAAMGMLAATVAHEINNPLSYVHGNLSLLKMELAALPLQDAQRRELADLTDDAIEGSNRVRDIVRDLRLYGRGSTDVIVSVDLRSVLAKVEKLTRSDVRTRGRLVCEVEGRGIVRGNEMRLVQILVNLVINAAQAILHDATEGNLIKVHVDDASNGEVEIVVEDSGSGIPAEQLPRIFDPFFSTKKGSGTGLGLSITRDLVRQLGGSITVQSTLNVGTKFSVLLQRAEEAPEVVVDEATEKTLSRRWRILVVDDEPLIGRAIERMLGEHDVQVVLNCADGIAQLGPEASWDAILCDAILGKESGSKLLDHLAAHAPQLSARLIVMTGGSPNDVGALGLPSSASVLWKPFDQRRLRDALVMLGDPGHATT